MALTDQQKMRLAFSVADLRRAPERAIFRQFCTAECAEDEPDFLLLKEAIMKALEEGVDSEIEGAKQKYRMAAARP